MCSFNKCFSDTCYGPGMLLVTADGTDGRTDAGLVWAADSLVGKQTGRHFTKECVQD